MNGMQRKFVLDALDNEDKLSGGDWDFINNLAENFDDKELSKKQNKWLNDISQKINRA